MTLLCLFLCLKLDLNPLGESRRNKVLFQKFLHASPSDPLYCIWKVFLFYMIYLCSTATKVHCDSEVTTALVWVLRAMSVFIMPRHRDMNSGSSCAGGQGWNSTANGPRVSWTTQRCFPEAQRQVVLFLCLPGDFHPSLFSAVH